MPRHSQGETLALRCFALIPRDGQRAGPCLALGRILTSPAQAGWAECLLAQSPEGTMALGYEVGSSHPTPGAHPARGEGGNPLAANTQLVPLGCVGQR